MRSPLPLGILLELYRGTIIKPGLPVGLPGINTLYLLICGNVSLDWSTMELVGKYGCQNAGSGPGLGSISLLKNAVLGLGLGFGLTLTLTLT